MGVEDGNGSGNSGLSGLMAWGKQRGKGSGARGAACGLARDRP